MTTETPNVGNMLSGTAAILDVVAVAMTQIGQPGAPDSLPKNLAHTVRVVRDLIEGIRAGVVAQASPEDEPISG